MITTAERTIFAIYAIKMLAFMAFLIRDGVTVKSSPPPPPPIKTKTIDTMVSKQVKHVFGIFTVILSFLPCLASKEKKEKKIKENGK